MAQMSEIGKCATTVHIDKDSLSGIEWTTVVYHTTPVVKFSNSMIILNTGGWYTMTTRKRMNQASNQFNLGYRVFQRDTKWYVEYHRKTIEFLNDTMSLLRI